MTEIVIRAIIYVVLGTIFYFIRSFVKVRIDKSNQEKFKEVENDNRVVVRNRKDTLWMGVIATVIAIAVFVYSFFCNYRIAIIGAIVLFLGCLSFGLYFNWQIEVTKDSDEFIYTTVFGRKHTVKYVDCKNYKIVENFLLLRTQTNKVFVIDVDAIYGKVFFDVLDKNNIQKK